MCLSRHTEFFRELLAHSKLLFLNILRTLPVGPAPPAVSLAVILQLCPRCGRAWHIGGFHRQRTRKAGLWKCPGGAWLEDRVSDGFIVGRTLAGNVSRFYLSSILAIVYQGLKIATQLFLLHGCAERI